MLREKSLDNEKIPGQGKVREFHFQSGKFRKNEKSQGVLNFSKKLIVNTFLKIIFSINCKQFIFRNIPFLISLV